MKASCNILYFRKCVVLILVMLTFMAMTGHSLSQWQDPSGVTAVESRDGFDDNAEGKETKVHLPAYQAIVPIVQLNLVHELYMIADLDLLHEIEVVEVIALPLYCNTYLRTLFRLIISPNAP